MKQDHLKFLCLHFDLGIPKREPQRVYGGLLHVMWCVDTDKASYAIKQLSKDIDLTDEHIVANYELSEHIASCFAMEGIPAISAIEKSGKYLLIKDGIGFLVYPWVDAKALDKDAVSAPQALEIAGILSKMHLMNLNIHESSEAEFDIHDNDKIASLIDSAKERNLPFADSLIDSFKNIQEVNKNYLNAIPILKRHTVVSHGDLDQKNVLWDAAKKPILIDWESARKLNPGYEVVNAALDWSGITTELDKTLFSKMIKTYREAGGTIDEYMLEAALYGVLGNWINWMVYNLKRAINADNPEEKAIGIEQVSQVLPTILRIKNLIPELIFSIRNKPARLEIKQAHDIAKKLIAEQFPQYAHLTISPVENNGWDNRTFHLGSNLLIRMPSAEAYELQVAKEQKWLPILAAHLSILIPEPIALGKPCDYYPWHWSICKWLDGASANTLVLGEHELEHLAIDLAQFLHELHKIDTDGGPLAGLHNYWRGDHVSVYDAQARSQLTELQDIIDSKSALALWEKAISSRWNSKPVWVHGDFASGNILVKDGKLAAVIDFGGLSIGDPACDLVIVWTLLKNKSREIFKEHVALDENTWERARGWALWKVTFELCNIADKSSFDAMIHRRIIEEIINEQR